MTVPRPEYPRPDLVRQDWLNLNGEWQFAFDDGDIGLKEGWIGGRDFDRRINVPFAYQCPLSGIHTRDFHHVIWYRRFFGVPEGWFGRRVVLNFGAVDYQASVYVNGKLALTHRGGHTPFRVDITKLLSLDNRNELVVRVHDDESVAQPRGKQSDRYESWACWYTRTSGIWQTVWLEPVGETAIERIRVNSWDLSGHVSVDVFYDAADPALRVKAEALWDGQCVAWSEGGPSSNQPTATAARCATLHLQIPSPKFWSPEQPQLYDLKLSLTRGGATLDSVLSYFGIRSFSLDGGSILLNSRGIFQRLVLDQGYWPEGLITAPSDEELKADIVRMKEMGFNGCRKHMKVEDPRFLYWADKLGYLVWGEFPACYEYSDASVQNFAAEWQEAVLRDRNHPCIVTWTPVNESWGIDQNTVAQRPDEISFLAALYHLTRSLDPTRPVNGNDGWQNPLTDLATIHDYAQDAGALSNHIESYIRDPGLKMLPSHGLLQHLPGYPYRGQPILVTEYGGIGLVTEKSAWGYGQLAGTPDELVARYDALTGALQQIPECVGFCYTQVTDVEQEQNGLYTYDRKPKVDPAKIRAINERRKT